MEWNLTMEIMEGMDGMERTQPSGIDNEPTNLEAVYMLPLYSLVVLCRLPELFCCNFRRKPL